MLQKAASLLCIVLLTAFFSPAQNLSSIGMFEQHSDVGHLSHKGKVVYDTLQQTYELSGAGANIWGNSDQFSFVWKKLKGDFILHARGQFVGKGVDPHRKFGWMVRTSLDTAAPMMSIQIHGDGLTSFQYRKAPGGNVEEQKSAMQMPDVLQLERRGSTFLMSVAKSGDAFTTSRLDSMVLGEEIYVGLFVCSHNKDVVEKAQFQNVRIVQPAPDGWKQSMGYLGSHIENVEVASGLREIVYSEPASLQAPNYLSDGKTLIYNKDGLIYKLPLATLQPEVLNTDFVKANNNDHVLSFDGKMLGLSANSSDPKWQSIIYTVPVTGGKPKQITPTGPSYLHGWSPDGKWLLFTGMRNGDYDIYKVPSNGGKEVRLTTTKGLDDGSEYSPDGKYIYYNSVRSGTMQIWRMKPDGTTHEQLTDDAFNNWFPHVSPDGKWVVMISYGQDVKPADHPFYKHVLLRLMPIGGGTPKVIAYLYGGQGTINTPSWSPDGKKIAFVSNTGME